MNRLIELLMYVFEFKKKTNPTEYYKKCTTQKTVVCELLKITQTKPN